MTDRAGWNSVNPTETKSCHLDQEAVIRGGLHANARNGLPTSQGEGLSTRKSVATVVCEKVPKGRI